MRGFSSEVFQDVLGVTVDGWPLRGVRVLDADVFLAADRPDRLDLSFVSGNGSPAACTAVEEIHPGSQVAAGWGDRKLFDGVVDRMSFRMERHRGRILSLVAYANYHGLRARADGCAYYQTTYSEVAAQVAALLELVSVVDRTEATHAQLVIQGDPLLWLRRRARGCEFQLAVTADRLYFVREPPGAGETEELRAHGAVLSVAIEDRGKGRGGRGGSLEVPGNPHWRPLSALTLKDVHPAINGTYRVIRALHSLGSRGYKTTLEILESGLDYALWEHGELRDEESHAG